ncbi:cyclase family protein [Hyphococcus luteus]|uniref:Cyclase n=1 Tax=Hyphococcus luteus TaxID=2058213 RepID=A0A2S7JZ96_9PROT|nr:cyclase family protein [Marinicaulis flavus]PQA85579.1 cyclase [Marinicaulis flavus]
MGRLAEHSLGAAAAAALWLGACTPAPDAEPAPPSLDLERYRIVDLSHAFAPDTIYWPTDKKGFSKKTVFEGEREDGWYAAFDIATAEHGGTHMDAPYHFDSEGDDAASVPLSRLIAPAVVIDVTDRTAGDRLYRVKPGDILAFEIIHGEIAPGTIVLVRTGWSQYWPNAKAYLGGTDPSALAFPSFGADAARFLIEEREAAALGIDTASTDYGPSTDFPVHRIMGAANTPGFENLANLDQLPPTGAYVMALPMKIEGGSGGPLRAVALAPKE